MPTEILNSVGIVLQIIVALSGAFMLAFWLSMVIWTFRDVRSRSRDIFAAILAGLMVLLFGPIGLLLYLFLRPRETLAEAYDRALEEEALLREIEERVVCSTCARPSEADWMLCPHCHTQLKRPCAECGRLLEMEWRLCPFCGSAPVAFLPTTSLDAAPAELVAGQE
jgi:RNA polymerase subunit RPABC4/transcription elongation factor Spt4